MKSTKLFLLASTTAILAISTTAPTSGTPFLELTRLEIAGLPEGVAIAADKLGHVIAFYDEVVNAKQADVYMTDINGKAVYLQQASFVVDNAGELSLLLDDGGDTMELTLKTVDIAKALKSAGLGHEIGLELRMTDGNVSALTPTRSAGSATQVCLVKVSQVDFAFWGHHGKQQMAQVTGDKRHGYRVLEDTIVDVTETIAEAEAA